MKNNEIETCEKLGRNRILEVEIKINICKIRAKHDKAFFSHEILNNGKYARYKTMFNWIEKSWPPNPNVRSKS